MNKRKEIDMSEWVAILTNGNIVREDEVSSWDDVKDELENIYMELDNGMKISLPPYQLEYGQAKTASASLDGGDVQIESRYIYFRLGNNIVKVRVDEKTSNISIEVD
jgi:hypothetical protein